MPVAAGRQIWPDGNHRTAMMVAEVVAELAGFTLVLDAKNMDEMRLQSKALIVASWSEKDNVSVEELRSSEHPVSRYYWTFRQRLELRPLPS